MSVPKQRRTKARTNRSGKGKKISVKKLQKCSKCSASIAPHRACPKCGYYKGREVIDTMKKVKKDKKQK